MHTGKLTKALLSAIRKKQNISHAKRARGLGEWSEPISCYAKRGEFFQPRETGGTDGEKRLSDVGKTPLVSGPKKDHVSKSRWEMVRNIHRYTTSGLVARRIIIRSFPPLHNSKRQQYYIPF